MPPTSTPGVGLRPCERAGILWGRCIVPLLMLLVITGCGSRKAGTSKAATGDMLVDATAARGGDLKSALRDLKMRFHLNQDGKIETIQLTDERIGNLSLKLLAEKAPDVKSLGLSGTSITDEGLTHLASLSNLELLNVAETKIGDAGVAEIAKLQGLKTLDVSGTPITAVAVAALAKMPQLSDLSLTNTQIGDAAVEGLASIAQLAYLNLNRTSVSDKALPALTQMTKLKGLYLDGTAVTPAGIQQLREKLAGAQVFGSFSADTNTTPQPRANSVAKTPAGTAATSATGAGRVGAGGSLATAPGSTDAPDTVVDVLKQEDDVAAGLQRLAEMDFWSTIETDGTGKLQWISLQFGPASKLRISDRGLSLLDGISTIADLDLNESPVTDAGVASLQRSRGLQTLDLSRTGVTDKCLVHLSELPRLHRLLLSDTAVADDGLQHLTQFDALRVMWLDQTRVTDAGLRHLAPLAQLEELNLSHTAVTDRGLVHLQGLTNLRILGLEGCALSADAVRSLQQKLPTCSILRHRFSPEAKASGE